MAELINTEINTRIAILLNSFSDLSEKSLFLLLLNELDELCKRARTNSSPEDFINFQLTNDAIRRMFNDCVVEFGFDKSEPSAKAETIII